MTLSDRPSKMDTAIALLQQLASLAAHDGEPCGAILLRAADYLQDMLDCMPELGGQDAQTSGMDDLDMLMAGLATALPEDGQLLHS